MSKLSLFSIILSLMLFGAFVFAGGFLAGYWVGGGSSPSLGGSYSGAQISTSGASSAIDQELSGIGLQNIAGQQAVYATQNAISGTPIPGVPSELQPFTSSVQFAASNAVAQKVGQNVTSSVGNTLSSKSTTGGSSSSQSPTSQTSSTAQSGQHYSVQLGVFATQENAQEMISRLQSKSYANAAVVPVKQSNGEVLYAVNSGDYPNYQTASAVAAQFAKQNIPGAMVVPIQPQGGKH